VEAHERSLRAVQLELAQWDGVCRLQERRNKAVFESKQRLQCERDELIEAIAVRQQDLQDSEAQLASCNTDLATERGTVHAARAEAARLLLVLAEVTRWRDEGLEVGLAEARQRAEDQAKKLRECLERVGDHPSDLEDVCSKEEMRKVTVELASLKQDLDEAAARQMATERALAEDERTRDAVRRRAAELQAELERLQAQNASAHGRCTPRPDWHRVVDQVPELEMMRVAKKELYAPRILRLGDEEVVQPEVRAPAPWSMDFGDVDINSTRVQMDALLSLAKQFRQERSTRKELVLTEQRMAAANTELKDARVQLRSLALQRQQWEKEEREKEELEQARHGTRHRSSIVPGST
jgi:chromosome segregation ATPase